MARIHYRSDFGDGYAIRTEKHEGSEDIYGNYFPGDSDGYVAAVSIARKNGWAIRHVTKVYDGQNIFSVMFVSKRKVGGMWEVKGDGYIYL